MAKTDIVNPKPGQKYPTPQKNDSLYRFYKSLFKQKKGGSTMAAKWCLEHGLFSHASAANMEAMLKLQNMKIKNN